MKRASERNPDQDSRECSSETRSDTHPTAAALHAAHNALHASTAFMVVDARSARIATRAALQ
eukprot:3305358-Lingulodinium_polyedra.AAC.1